MIKSSLEYRVAWLPMLLGGLGWTVFYTFMLEAVFELEMYSAALESIAMNALLFLSLFVSINSIRYFSPSTDRAIYLISAASIASAIVVVLDRLVLSYFFDGAGLEGFSEKALFFHGGFAFLANAAAIGLGMQFSQIKEQTVSQDRRDEAERLTKEAELLKLRHQLQPHFLFNSLNSINALIVAEPKEARKMVQQLSAFLRGTIKTDQAKIEFAKELEHVQLYLEIEKVRFGHRLQTNLDIADDALPLSLPPLLLQPLMENAIKFGLYGTTEDVMIDVIVKSINGFLEISIANPIDADLSTQEGTRFGLNAIKRRLYLTYGRDDLLMTRKTENSFIATLKVPQQS